MTAYLKNATGIGAALTNEEDIIMSGFKAMHNMNCNSQSVASAACISNSPTLH